MMKAVKTHGDNKVTGMLDVSFFASGCTGLVQTGSPKLYFGSLFWNNRCLRLGGNGRNSAAALGWQ